MEDRAQRFIQAINKTADAQQSLQNEIEYIQTVTRISQESKQTNQWKQITKNLSTFKKHHSLQALINNWPTDLKVIPNFTAFDEFAPNGDIPIIEKDNISKEALVVWTRILFSTELPPQKVNASFLYINILIHSTIPTVFNFFLTETSVKEFVDYVLEIYSLCQDTANKIQPDAYMRVVESAFESPLFLRFIHNTFLVNIRTLIDHKDAPNDYAGFWDLFMSRAHKYGTQCPKHITHMLSAINMLDHTQAVELLRQGVTRILESPARFGLAAYHEWQRVISHGFLDYIHNERVINGEPKRFFTSLFDIIIERGGRAAAIYPDSGNQVNALHDLLLVRCFDTYDLALEMALMSGALVPSKLGTAYSMQLRTRNINALIRGSFMLDEPTSIPREIFTKHLREYLKFAPQMPHFTEYPAAPPSLLDVFKSNIVFAPRCNKYPIFNALLNLENCENVTWMNLDTEEDFNEYMAILDTLVRHHTKNEVYLSCSSVVSSITEQLAGLAIHTENLRKHFHCVMQEFDMEAPAPFPDMAAIYETPALLYRHFQDELKKTKTKITPINSRIAYEIALHRTMKRLSMGTFLGHRPDLRAKDALFARIVGEHTREIIAESINGSKTLDALKDIDVINILSERFGLIFEGDTTPLQKWLDFNEFGRILIDNEMSALGVAIGCDERIPISLWCYALAGSNNVISTLLYTIEFIWCMPEELRSVLHLDLASYTIGLAFTMLEKYGASFSLAELAATFQIKGEITVFGRESSLARQFVAAICHIPLVAVKDGCDFIATGVLGSPKSVFEQRGIMLTVHFVTTPEAAAKLKTSHVISFAGSTEADAKEAWSVLSKAGDRAVFDAVLCAENVNADKKGFSKKSARHVIEEEFPDLFKEIGQHFNDE